MPDSFLILLAGGVMLAVAIPRPKDVTVQWLRLGGILALAFAGVGVFFLARRGEALDPGASALYLRVQRGILIATVLSILGQLAFAQSLWRRTQRAFALGTFFFAVMAGTGLIHTAVPQSTFSKPSAIALQTLACAGVAAMTGIVLMDMLLGHAYLTAARMTIAPFRRINFILGAVVLARILLAGAALMIQSIHPIELFWARFGLHLMTRWFVGLIVPAAFVYMAHDCIKRRSTQSATGILYVAGVLIFIGELVALHLARETGLPL